MSDPQEPRVRELLLLRYCAALDRGDLDELASILRTAETDSALEEMIREVHYELHGASCQAEARETSQLLLSLLREHLPAATEAAEADGSEAPPLTVADVLGRMRTDALIGPEAQQASKLASHPAARETPLPEDLTRAGVRRLFEQLGLSAGKVFLDLFRNTANQLELRREQRVLRLAATRRQRSASRTPPEDDPQ